MGTPINWSVRLITVMPIRFTRRVFNKVVAPKDPYERYKEQRMDSSKKKIARIVIRKEWVTVTSASPYKKYFIIYVDPDTLLPIGWLPSGGGAYTPLVVKEKELGGEIVKEPLIPLLIDKDEKYDSDELANRLEQRIDDWWTNERDEELSMVFMVSALPLSALDSIAKLGGATSHLPSSHLGSD